MLGRENQGGVSQSLQILLNAISRRNVCSFHCCSADTANLAAFDHSDIAQGASGMWRPVFSCSERNLQICSVAVAGILRTPQLLCKITLSRIFVLTLGTNTRHHADTHIDQESQELLTVIKVTHFSLLQERNF